MLVATLLLLLPPLLVLALLLLGLGLVAGSSSSDGSARRDSPQSTQKFSGFIHLPLTPVMNHPMWFLHWVHSPGDQAYLPDKSQSFTGRWSAHFIQMFYPGNQLVSTDGTDTTRTLCACPTVMTLRIWPAVGMPNIVFGPWLEISATSDCLAIKRLHDRQTKISR